MKAETTQGVFDLHTKRVLLFVILAYVLLVIIFALAGRFAFIAKSAIFPALFIVAFVSGHLRRFVADWTLFLCQILLFDSFRGLIFSIVSRYELPVYMVYLIKSEHALLGGTTLPNLLQDAWHGSNEIGLLEQFFAIVYGSHYLFFLLFALVVWYVNRSLFESLKSAMLVVMYLGLLGYLLIPSVPPWMAGDYFAVLPPVAHLSNQVYNLAIPSLRNTFDTNPIAAMPSLHAAFPTVCCFFATRHFGLKSLPLYIYLLLVFLATAYLGDHYLVDLIGGVALAAIGIGVAIYLEHRKSSRENEPNGGEESNHVDLFSQRMKVRLAIAILVLIAGEAVGHLALMLYKPFVPSEAFIERELVGRSHRVAYFRAIRAIDADDYPLMTTEFERAYSVAQDDTERRSILSLLAGQAYGHKDYESAVEYLRRFEPDTLTPGQGLLLTRALFRTNRFNEAMQTLEKLRNQYPDDPEILQNLTVHKYQSKQMTREEVKDVIRQLRARPGAEQNQELAIALEIMIGEYKAP